MLHVYLYKYLNFLQNWNYLYSFWIENKYITTIVSVLFQNTRYKKKITK